ncbi:MAG: metallophosphoesterase [Promethearchaeota archaeon]
MKIGIISDTHDNMPVIEKFVTKFKEKGVNMVLHCGDFCSPFVARKFVALGKDVEFHGVFGNNDGDHAYLNKLFAEIGVLHENYHVIEVNNRKILMLHGHAIQESMIDAIARKSEFDFILYGHYHHVRNEKVGDKTLVLNPGEACGYLTGKSTAMILEFLPDDQNNVSLITL